MKEVNLPSDGTTVLKEERDTANNMKHIQPGVKAGFERTEKHQFIICETSTIPESEALDLYSQLLNRK